MQGVLKTNLKENLRFDTFLQNNPGETKRIPENVNITRMYARH